MNIKSERSLALKVEGSNLGQTRTENFLCFSVRFDLIGNSPISFQHCDTTNVISPSLSSSIDENNDNVHLHLAKASAK